MTIDLRLDKQDADTLKAMLDLLCRAYGTSGDNRYRLNCAFAASVWMDKLAAAERVAQSKPELVKTDDAA